MILALIVVILVIGGCKTSIESLDSEEINEIRDEFPNLDDNSQNEDDSYAIDVDKGTEGVGGTVQNQKKESGICVLDIDGHISFHDSCYFNEDCGPEQSKQECIPSQFQIIRQKDETEVHCDSVNNCNAWLNDRISLSLVEKLLRCESSVCEIQDVVYNYDLLDLETIPSSNCFGILGLYCEGRASHNVQNELEFSLNNMQGFDISIESINSEECGSDWYGCTSANGDSCVYDNFPLTVANTKSLNLKVECSAPISKGNIITPKITYKNLNMGMTRTVAIKILAD